MIRLIFAEIGIIFFALALGFTPLAKAQSEPVSIAPTASWADLPNDAGGEISEPDKTYAAVRYVRRLLQNELDNQLAQTDYQAPIVKSRNVPMQIIAALWNKARDEYDLVRLLKENGKLKPINNSAYTFRLLKDNGVNSLIEVSNRPDLTVLGLIHPVFSDISTSNETRYRLDHVVYIPYSSAIDTEIMARQGETYLNKKINSVYAELNNLGIKSYAFPNKKITEVIDQSVVKTILAIEHVDATVLLTNRADNYIRKFYVTLAANEHTSYAYAKSSASARGLVQFIPSTYHSLRRLRPELTLPSDFTQGMTDPYNAIKAEIALLDYNLSLLPSNIAEKYQTEPQTIGAYLAAMYNGGPSRVKRAIATWGNEWHLYHGNNRASLKRETAYYVAKFNLVYKHFQTAPLHLASVNP
jgi:hypothetical protein